MHYSIMYNVHPIRYQYTKAETKYTPFCRRLFKCIFMNEIIDIDFTEIYSQGPY